MHHKDVGPFWLSCAAFSCTTNSRRGPSSTALKLKKLFDFSFTEGTKGYTTASKAPTPGSLAGSKSLWAALYKQEAIAASWYNYSTLQEGWAKSVLLVQEKLGSDPLNIVFRPSNCVECKSLYYCHALDAVLMYVGSFPQRSEAITATTPPLVAHRTQRHTPPKSRFPRDSRSSLINRFV